MEQKDKKVVKVKHYPYEKENLKNPRICKVCGKDVGIYGLVGGICENCHNRANGRLRDRKGFVWDNKQKEM